MTRRNAREQAFFVLFEKIFDNDSAVSEIVKKAEENDLIKVSLAVMRLAVTEMKFSDEIPDGVAVNEAVEIAKKYGTPDDASYINGVLGSVSRS